MNERSMSGFNLKPARLVVHYCALAVCAFGMVGTILALGVYVYQMAQVLFGGGFPEPLALKGWLVVIGFPLLAILVAGVAVYGATYSLRQIREIRGSG